MKQCRRYKFICIERDRAMKEWLVGTLVVVFFVIALGTVCNLVTNPPFQSEFSPDLVMQSVVHIGASGDYGDWQGSGVYVGNGLILTAGHVVDGADTFVVSFEDSQSSYASSTFYKEPTADVGFILLEGYDGPTLVFDNDGYDRGDTAFIFGSPFGWDYKFSVSKGIIASVQRDCDGFFGEKILLQSDAASYPGNSGGAVTDDEGEIIGILVGGMWGSDNISLIIPADICRQSMRIYLEILKLASME